MPKRGSESGCDRLSLFLALSETLHTKTVTLRAQKMKQQLSAVRWKKVSIAIVVGLVLSFAASTVYAKWRFGHLSLILSMISLSKTVCN
jgi:hypothetical protein